MEQVRDRGLHEKVYILGGVTPLKSARMAEYMRNNVAGMDIPDSIIDRISAVPKKEARREGINICIETIQQLKEMDGICGVHIMAIEWEEIVAEIVKRAGLLPRKKPQVSISDCGLITSTAPH
jgi:methylenetetrahydrofolate reductase (NADPH)